MEWASGGARERAWSGCARAAFGRASFSVRWVARAHSPNRDGTARSHRYRGDDAAFIPLAPVLSGPSGNVEHGCSLVSGEGLRARLFHVKRASDLPVLPRCDRTLVGPRRMPSDVAALALGWCHRRLMRGAPGAGASTVRTGDAVTAPQDSGGRPRTGPLAPVGHTVHAANGPVRPGVAPKGPSRNKSWGSRPDGGQVRLPRLRGTGGVLWLP